MSTPAQVWNDALKRLDALSLRERVLVFAAAISTLLAALVAGVILPALETSARLDAEIVALEARTRQIKAQLAQPAAPAGGRPARPDLAQYEARARATEDLAATMRRLIQAQTRVRLLELALLPPQPLLTETPLAADAAATDGSVASPEMTGASPAAPPPAIDKAAADNETSQWYAHPIRLELEGGYAELAATVQALEQLPGLVEWRAVRLDASAHPRIRLSVELANIRKEAGWRKS